MATIATQRLTASAALSPPKSGMYLREIQCHAGTTAGTLSINYDGAASAHFPVPSNGTRGQQTHQVSWKIVGSTIPAASITFNGGLTSVVLVYSEEAPGGHPPIESYRALRFARTDGSAVTGDVTVSFAGVATAKPKYVVAHISASAGRVQFPASGSFQAAYDAFVSDTARPSLPAPDLKETASLTLSLATDAAATIQVIVGY